MSDFQPPSDRARPPHPSGPRPGHRPEVRVTQQASGMAITGLVLGIFGLCFMPLSIAALVLGIVALTQIADPNRGLTGRGMAITATVLGGLGIIVMPIALFIGIMLPAIGAARRTARQVHNMAQVRGITQGLSAYSGNNNSYYPGLDASGNPVDLTVEYRYSELLNNNYFSGGYAINPIDTKTVWTTGPVTKDNYSYDMLDVSDKERRRAWRDSINTRAVTISDRNTGTSNALSDVSSLYTHGPGNWNGSIGRGDGSASFEISCEQETQYGSGPVRQNDNIFEQSGPDDAVMIYTGD